MCSVVYLVPDNNPLFIANPSSPSASNSDGNESIAETHYIAGSIPNPEREIQRTVPMGSPSSSASVNSFAEAPQGIAGPTRELAANLPPKYFVRTPSLVVYGPSEESVVLEWISQGRLDDTCHIRSESSSEWLGIPAWRFQLRQSRNAFVETGTTSGAVNRKSDNPFFVPVPRNQSAVYVRTGQGMIVLVLGIVSWVLCLTAIGAPICSVIAVILGIKELKAVREGRSQPSERPLALIGLCLGILNLIVTFGSIIAIMILTITNP